MGDRGRGWIDGPLSVTPTGVDELAQWWRAMSEKEISEVAMKAAEYGPNSLTEVGHQIAKISGRAVDDEEAAEIGCYFYIVGKMGRWSDALARGQRPSDDTIYDIGVYTRMVQRIRVCGTWPGLTHG